MLTQRISAFIRDLRRRRVFRVAAVYLLVGWALVQVAVNTFPYLPLPEWMITAVIVVVALGFAPAVFLAWAFDLHITRDEGPASPASNAGARAGPRLLPRSWKDGAAAAATRAFRRRRASAPARSEPPSEQRVNKAVVAHLRHELRNPLNAVIGYCEMVLEDLPADAPGATRDRLIAVNLQARALLPLIDGFLPPLENVEPQRGNAANASALQRIAEVARQLAADAQQLVAELPNDSDPALLQDTNRIAAAAARLTTVVDELQSPQRSGAESNALRQTRTVAERVLSRIQPLDGAVTAAAIPASILVVDDNSLNRDLLCRQLARSGFMVVSANGGAEALQRLRTGTWDLVLLDVMMPDIDGLEVLERIKEDERLHETPVVMISALDEIDSVVRCLELGAVDYLTKPFDPVLLHARIGAVLELRQLQDVQGRLRRSLLEAESWNERFARSSLPQPWSGSNGGPRDGVQMLPEVAVLVVDLRGTAAFADPDELLATVRDYVANFRQVAEQYPVHTLSGARRLIAFGQDASATSTNALVQLAIDLGALSSRDRGALLNPGIGIQVGRLVVGIDARDHVLCGIWGEAVDVAERLAAIAPPHGVYISPAVHAQLDADYSSNARGVLEFANGLQMRTYEVRAGRGRGIGAHQGSRGP